MEQDARAKSKEELRHELLALGVIAAPGVGASLGPEPTILVRQTEEMRTGQSPSKVVVPGQLPLDQEHVGLIWQLVDAQQQKIRDDKKAWDEQKAADNKKAAEDRKARQEAQRSKVLQLMRMSDADAAATEIAANAFAEKEAEMQKVEALLQKLDSSRRSFASENAVASGDMLPGDASKLLSGCLLVPAQSCIEAKAAPPPFASPSLEMRLQPHGVSHLSAFPERVRRSKSTPAGTLSSMPLRGVRSGEPGGASQSSRELLSLASQRGASSLALERARRGNITSACSPQSSRGTMGSMSSSRDSDRDLMDAVFARAQARQDAIEHGKRSERAKHAVNRDARATGALALFDLDGCQSTARSSSFALGAAAGLGSRNSSFARNAYASARMAAC